MEELFQVLSSSARINKSKRPKNNEAGLKNSSNSKSLSTAIAEDTESNAKTIASFDDYDDNDNNNDDSHSNSDDDDTVEEITMESRDRTGKRDKSEAKQRQIHQEEIAAFRRSMTIKIKDKHDPDLPDPITTFVGLQKPLWWTHEPTFINLKRTIQRNIEQGNWKEPTPIQMQGIPVLLNRKDLIGSAPTGSGKSGAFIIPALYLCSAAHHIYHGLMDESIDTNNNNNNNNTKITKNKTNKEGEIRCLILAPSLELAGQLHREVDRLGLGKPGGLKSLLLQKSNANTVISGHAGGKNGLDVLVSTPMRLVDAIEKGLKLDGVRFVVLDEADRLLDASDGKSSTKNDLKEDTKGSNNDNSDQHNNTSVSGSQQSQTFLAQMDVILSQIPSTAVRALFSATINPKVRELSQFFLRNYVDMTVGASASGASGINTNIKQELKFVGREQGKLLAIRQIVARGELKPPAIVFLESQERAQALFRELLYDNIRVDIIHAGRSKAAREDAVAKFRQGDTWVLICTDLVARGVDFRAVNMVINYDLPTSGVTYIHRIGRTGRAGRKGTAITFFTEADFDNLRSIANLMKQSGCDVPDWMLQLSSKHKESKRNNYSTKRASIDTTPTMTSLKKKRKVQKPKKK